MYIRITSKCNMACDHCCYACEPGKGRHMSMKTFKNALEFVAQHDEGIELGGGEPTIHPKFWEILGLSLSVGDVWLATNGTMTDTSLRLCSMARRGVIGCALSMDYYHDQMALAWDVVEAFQDGMERSVCYNDKGGRYYSDYGYRPKSHGTYGEADFNDRREIRDIGRNVAKQGRAIETEVWHKDKECAGPGLRIDPDGTIRGCACSDSPKFGNVNNDVTIPEDWNVCECSREQEARI